LIDALTGYFQNANDDSDQANLLLTQDIAMVNGHFPDSLIGICVIFPGKGNGNNTNILN
jgi:hypothetical protein